MAPSSPQSLEPLVKHLAGRREHLLRVWRERVQSDEELTAPLSLSRSQFRDHVPAILRAFEKTLHAGLNGALRVADQNGAEGSEHGSHRWQHGYNQVEVMREWSHLQDCLAEEIEAFSREHAELNGPALARAYRAHIRFFGEGICESTREFERMQRAEAAGQAFDLEQALRDGHELQRRQAEILRGAAHDLRGQLGVISSAAEVLRFENLPQDMRAEVHRTIQVALHSQQELLTSLMDLARLQAGQEERCIESFDAAALLTELCRSTAHLAQERELILEAQGSPSLVVQGDPLRVRRIAQNLLLNALKYTERGRVTVRWGIPQEDDAERWMLCVEDTGPGFHAGPGGPLAGALEETTRESRALDQNGDRLAARAPDTRPERQRHGEGIGLSIVKRLCELLDATLELESEIDQGSVFRVILPREYPDG